MASGLMTNPAVSVLNLQRNKLMSERLKVLIVGTGTGGEGSGGAHSIGYAHAKAFVAHPDTELVAACDLDVGNIKRFQETFGITEASTDLTELMRRVQPDIVSICTNVSSHRLLFDKVISFGPKGIMMEKPFTLFMDEGRHMVKSAQAAGTKMIVNHFRRLLPSFAKAREFLDDKVIGDITLIAASVDGWDQMEWGTHWLDMIRFFKHDTPVEWVFGQVECSGKPGVKTIFGREVNYGHIVEDHSMNYFCFKDGTRALLDAGKGLNSDAIFSFLGKQGVMYLYANSKIGIMGREGYSEYTCDCTLDAIPANKDHPMIVSVDSLVQWINKGTPSEIAAENALKSSELYLAAYASAVHQKRVDMPMGEQSEFPLNFYAKKKESINSIQS
jgi:predicted dehydrogenase